MTRTIAVTLLLAAVLGAAGCSPLGPIPDRSRYYTLSVPPPARAEPAATDDRAVPIVYGLGPVILPAYLDRAQVATRISAGEVAYSQWDRWAEPLGGNVTSILRQSIAAELGTDDLVTYPWIGSTRVDYQIEVRLLRFESDTAGETRLAARWSIRDVAHDRQLVARETALQRPGRPGDSAAATAAMSAMLGDLSREIATSARDLPRPAARPSKPAAGTKRPPK